MKVYTVIRYSTEYDNGVDFMGTFKEKEDAVKCLEEAYTSDRDAVGKENFEDYYYDDTEAELVEFDRSTKYEIKETELK